MDSYILYMYGQPIPAQRIGNLIYDRIIIYNTFYYDRTANLDHSGKLVPLMLGGGEDDYLFWLLSVCLFNIVRIQGGNIKLLTLDKQKLIQNPHYRHNDATIFNELIPRNIPPGLSEVNIGVGVKKLELDASGLILILKIL